MEKNQVDRLIGRILFKLFRIKKKLGEGSFGKVYIVNNIETNDLYAVKLVSKNEHLILTTFKYYRKNMIKIVIY
jgi:serine/threonine protein kinase